MQDSRKTLAYAEICEALHEDGCAVCFLLLRRSLIALESLLYEQITDPATRVQLRRAQGFCNWHAWLLADNTPGRSGVAIIYEDLLRYELVALRHLQAEQHPMSRWQRLRRRLTARAVSPERRTAVCCPICRSLGAADETGYLTTLLNTLTDAAFARAFQQAFGLCLPHLHRAVTDHPGHANLPLLLALQNHKLEVLHEQLKEFIRKSDYRFAREPVGVEGGAWRRAVEFFVGKPGVFGHHRAGQ